MADILIRGMEMPKSCDVCPFVGTNDDLMSDDYRYMYCGFPYVGQYVTDYEATRHADCPLVLLPEGHGRLIDADSFKADCLAATKDAKPDFVRHEDWLKSCAVTMSFCRDIDERPTIVPAEGVNDNG